MNRRVLSVLFVLGIILVSGCARTTVEADCWAYNFNKVYELKGDDLEKNFNDFIADKTEILKECKVKGYAKVTNERIKDVQSVLEKYSINRYNVSFSCDILDFDVQVSERSGNFYMLHRGLGPCGETRVIFTEGKNYYSEHFEEYIIELKEPFAKQNLNCGELNQAIRYQLNRINLCETSEDCELLYFGVEGETFTGCGEPVNKLSTNNEELNRLLEFFNEKRCMHAVVECLPFEGKLSCIDYECVITSSLLR